MLVAALAALDAALAPLFVALAVWLAPDEPDPLTAVGRSEIVIPAEAQSFVTAGAISRTQKASATAFKYHEYDGHGINSLLISSAEHLPGTQLVMLLVMASLPVVHWHFWSVRLQPEAGTAAAKQERAQVGISLRSWAEAAVARARAERRVEKRIFEICLFEFEFEVVGVWFGLESLFGKKANWCMR